MEKAKIAKKLVAVMSECSHVCKNGLNSYHQYKYATAEDVLCKVNEALTKNKLASVVTPALDSVVDVVNLKGNKEHLATISVKIELIDSDSGESIVLQGFGSGQDAGDKAIMKAQTAAIKYASCSSNDCYVFWNSFFWLFPFIFYSTFPLHNPYFNALLICSLINLQNLLQSRS